MLYYQLSFKVKTNAFDYDELTTIMNKNTVHRPPGPDAPYFLFTDYNGEQLSCIAAVPCENDALTNMVDRLRRCVELNMPQIRLGRLTLRRELTVQEFFDLGEATQNNGLCSYRAWRQSSLGLNYLTNSPRFSFTEKLFPAKLKRTEALEGCRDIMGDVTLEEELKRIYSSANKRSFYAHPVHYKITAGNRAACEELLELLVTALHNNKRLLGSRLEMIYDIQSSLHNAGELEELVSRARGNAVAIFMNADTTRGGRFASNYSNVIDALCQLIRKHGSDTLFFLVDISTKNGFGKELLLKVQSTLDLIEVKEGIGDRATALNYLHRLAGKHDIAVSDEELSQRLGTLQEYTAAEVQSVCRKWYSHAMKTHVYKAYRHVERKAVKESSAENNAYKELQQMVGLTTVKSMVDEIISTARMQKLRREMGLKETTTSLHACFTGNPGCAKTTVARLLARILKKEGILKTGKYVEVGRGDLVGRYVGWTAKLTEKKFREAHGGILFVDECYALADDSNSFGTEAINTLVQLMENHRDDVIVIFAGYPQKVKDFLAKNEGLRSRISFHLSFPDYGEQDLTEILHLMAKDKGYLLAPGVDEAVGRIFAEACENEEFGNGRFARTLLEQAMMRQANRLFSRGDEITRADAELLLPEDFQVNVSKLYAAQRSRLPLGFCS